MISPPVNNCPFFSLTGVNSHSLSGLREGTSTPLGTYTLFDILEMTSKGLWIPSKICSNNPGPSCTARGEPVLSTGSPTVSPEVSS